MLQRYFYPNGAQMRGRRGLIQDVVKDEGVNRSRRRHVGGTNAIYCEISFTASTATAQRYDVLCWQLIQTYIIDTTCTDKDDLV